MKVRDMMKGLRWGQGVRANNPPVHILQMTDYDPADTFHRAYCGAWQPEWKRSTVRDFDVCKSCLRIGRRLMTGTHEIREKRKGGGMTIMEVTA